MQQTLQLLHEIVWGPWTMLLFLGTGLFFTVKSGGFQIRKLPYWWKKTVGSLGKGSISSFQTSCTALAATIGTGNIVGVATALTAGGPGAVFWLWISALIGMATAYAETSLGQKYRYRRPDGTWQCGPMVSMERGLGCRSLGLIYALFAVLASLGMGSMVQANAVSETLCYEAGMKQEIAAVLVTALTAAVVWGGIRRISRMTSWFVPLSAGIYFFFSVRVLVVCRRSIPVVLGKILKEAWTPGAAGGGIAGFLFSRSVRFGLARGVFSNEAGLGTLAVLHGAVEDTTPEEQGMWAMFEVFVDTMVICTLTALVILCAGMESGLDGAALTSFCFTKILGSFGGFLVSISMAAFAFATIVGWYYIGRQMFSYLAEYLCPGVNTEYLYIILYLLAVWLGCICRLELVWLMSDLVNGLMAYPNLLSLWLLADHVQFPKIKAKK
ncbi:sodium:alanine symporter family protein [Clostridium sp. OM02-18AC]|uniref:alanine/glycine:cation symporter family protein n=1 Tax=Clostridium sp. OM02-18AC TaxID=2292311 RepID=UPI000E54A340|nr:amino acid carrier protein [Clostridium sp. OM02-18AC]RHV67240.1 sodium:alanine symporter family protein [Clostridium sp. OM02-18AC]